MLTPLPWYAMVPLRHSHDQITGLLWPQVGAANRFIVFLMHHKHMLSCISVTSESIFTPSIPFESSFDALSNNVQHFGLSCQGRDFKHLTSVQGVRLVKKK